MLDDLPAALAKAWPYLVVAAPGLWIWWKDLRGERQVKRKEHADLVQIAQNAAAKVIEDLSDEIGRMRGRIDELERELADLRKEHARVVADKDAKITLLEGEKRQLEAKVAAYERVLKAAGVPLPVAGETYWTVVGGEVVPAASNDEPQGRK